ncbi:hypothetical protein QBC34DRAFT_495091 [Podospora aff. communis PSN243]|uniref:Uncharacterized protein n=1 Tax=Podospora aff. communis PSN243 TaxID=3040156 RepID=A0AAV9GJP8_9PEZI|nr:hypothetical protein QBC34DRAFT_495091 [Podospora aff. communis PSN243]
MSSRRTSGESSPPQQVQTLNQGTCAGDAGAGASASISVTSGRSSTADDATNPSTNSTTTTVADVEPGGTGRDADHDPVPVHEMDEAEEGECTWKEWHPWELWWGWLVLQLLLATGGGATVAGLASYSRAHSGFVRLGPPPTILTGSDDLMDAIWWQGWLYTAIPVSLMTLYRTMWGLVVASLALRAPYVELRKPGGGPPSKTVLLDYRAQWSLGACRTAWQTGHWFLCACMALSIVLSFVVAPSAAFLFVATTATSSSVVPLRYTSRFNYSAIRGPVPLHAPSAQTALEWGAATMSLGAPPLHWTNGTHAFSPFVFAGSANDLPWPDNSTQNPNSGPPKPVPIVVDSTAHFFRPDCIALRQGVDYHAVVRPGGVPGLNTALLSISGRDRGCSFGDELIFNLREPLFTPFRPLAAKTFQRVGCEAGNHNNGSIVGLVAARYTGDRIADHRVSDVSVVSCKPRYWAVPGVLNATLAQPPSDSPLAAITGFHGDWSRAEEYTEGDHIYIESAFVEPLAFDPSLPIQVPTQSLARHVVELAWSSSSSSSSSSLSSRNVIDRRLNATELALSMGELLERAYAAVAASILTTTLQAAKSHVGYVAVSEVRIAVREPVAWLVVSTLLITAALLAYVLGVERHKPAALFEEPVGLLSVAGIAQRSAHLTGEIEAIGADPRFRGTFREDAMASNEFMATNWRFDQVAGHIVNTTGRGLKTARGAR